MKTLNLQEFKAKINEDVIILDTRNADDFKESFIPGSIFIGLEGQFAEWSGNLLPFHQKIILVTYHGMEEETIIRLEGIGFDNVEGYLQGGFETWKNAGEQIDIIIDVDVDELAVDLPYDPNLKVIDVRKPNEFAEGHVKDAINLNLADMTDLLLIAQLEETQNLYIHCAGEYRSLIACSLLKRQGYNNLRNINGGWDKIKEHENIRSEKEASMLN